MMIDDDDDDDDNDDVGKSHTMYKYRLNLRHGAVTAYYGYGQLFIFKGQTGRIR